MIVVADSSPLIVLINIGHIDILPRIFGQVIVPPEITAELSQDNRPQTVRDFISSPPSWLIEQRPGMVETIPMLDVGECAAISLARELDADLLLIDEIQGRRAALEHRLRITGTIGVLEMASANKLIDLKEAFERIKRTDFWISHDLLDERLKLHLSSYAP